MSDEKDFEEMKSEMLAENAKKYGDEVIDTWGEDSFKQSQEKVAAMSQEQWEDAGALGNAVNEALKAAMATGDPGGELAHKACDLHRQWLEIFWPDGMYTADAHRLMGQMYVADPRFKAHYDDIAPGAAEFFKEAIDAYTA
jgi:hypothetical protein